MKQYIVDAFTDTVFHGNPAAVCILEEFLSEELMIHIVSENNLSETAFAVKKGDNYALRWFTPESEIDLCGHATLATAYVIMNYYEPDAQQLSFETLSGTLTVQRHGDLYEMDFPAFDLKEVPVTESMTQSLGVTPLSAYMGRDLLCVLADEDLVVTLTPNLDLVKGLDGLLCHVTTEPKDKTKGIDCVSRTFAPKLGVPEDPVCGSGYCHIVPYWVKQLGKTEITAYQASRRGGTLYCKQEAERIKMAGKAALYAVAELHV
ncbi:MAG: PhzF family phenazine biosynthesis protein [Veillonella caviae]|nr:PhzF family phenazine biosynthesis protein [Veillonella caviae]